MMIGANALLNPSRFEGWSTTVEEAKAVGTPMLLSDIPVHREQAPNARFFGTEDAAALADAIEASPPRSFAAIEATARRARAASRERQAAFGTAVSRIVREAVGQT
jgi:glycosyltransferase involved in cell wall biosynthesis